jgi:Eukaryotic aspartyl protease
MGVGFTANEANGLFYGSATHPSILDNLKSEGYLNVKAFSLWLDNLNSNTGSILLGSIDHSKYLGVLIATPIQPDIYTANYTSFVVSLTGIAFTVPPDTFLLYSDDALPVLLDRGTSLPPPRPPSSTASASRTTTRPARTSRPAP